MHALGLHLTVCYFGIPLRIMATCSDSDDESSSALILCIIYTDEGYSDWKPWRNDHEVIVLLFTLIFCVMMYILIEKKQVWLCHYAKLEATKIFNFTHVQTAKTRHSFRHT